MRTLIVLLFALCGCDAEGDGKDVDPTETGEIGEDTDPVEPDPEDADGDGFTDDCDDNNANVFPGNSEYCDGLDNDCDSEVDEDAVDATPWYRDADGDGYGDPDFETLACEAPVGHVANTDDCDDTDARFNPSAIEADCEDPSDYNCDGSVGYTDDDSDGFAACAECDDSDADVNPDADETCNGIDDDCDGLPDADDPDLVGGSTFYGDSDGDGYGGQQYEAVACEAPPGFVDNSDDCDDLEPLSYPSAAEVCDDKDNDCDGAVDEGVGFTWYADADGDGYGEAASSTTACDMPPGYSANGDDCDDSAPSAHPGGVEVCNGADDDCDGVVDGPSALNATTFYADFDGDGYGDAASPVTDCSAPSGHVANDDDCDDTNVAIHPTASETCDNTDNNCDGSTDEASAIDAPTWYADLDGDGYGSSTTSQAACSAPPGYVADATDCDDLDPGTSPSGTEICDSVDADEDCDGAADDADGQGAGGKTMYYVDGDSDGYGDNADAGAAWCDPPSGVVSDSTDCDDAASSTHPGASETCDSVDADCDGNFDDPGQDNCHVLASCTDPGTGYTCTCGTGYDGDGTSTCDLDPFPASVLLDSTQKAQLNNWAGSVGQSWTLCYRKSTHGGDAGTFHGQCDGYSTTFSVAQLSTNVLIGGFTNTSWVGGSFYTGTSANFLFSLTQGYRIMSCTGQHACTNYQYNRTDYGPTFGGGHDWHINNNIDGGYCNLGHDYGCQVGSYSTSSCQNDFCGNYSSWSINDLEVWGR